MPNGSNQAIELKRATIRIQGESPLICPLNRRPEEILTPDEEFERSLRPMGEGHWGFPSDGLYSALMTAAGRSLRGVMNLAGGPLIEIAGSQPKKRTDYGSEADHPHTCRAEFFPWEMTIRLQYDSARVTISEVTEWFERAGFQVGIGSRRVERGGTFGTFSIKNVMECSRSYSAGSFEQESLHCPGERPASAQR
jgi:hypothetical protein